MSFFNVFRQHGVCNVITVPQLASPISLPSWSLWRVISLIHQTANLSVTITTLESTLFTPDTAPRTVALLYRSGEKTFWITMKICGATSELNLSRQSLRAQLTWFAEHPSQITRTSPSHSVSHLTSSNNHETWSHTGSIATLSWQSLSLISVQKKVEKKSSSKAAICTHLSTNRS